MMRRALTSSWPAFVVTVVLTAAILHRFELSLALQGTYAAYLLVGVVLPGVFAWRALLAPLHRAEQPPTWFEDLTLGTIFGFGVQLPFFLLSVAVDFRWLTLLPAAVAAGSSLTSWGRSVWRLPTGRLDVRAAWAFPPMILFGLLWMAWNDFARRPLSVPSYRIASVDETFHQALVADVSTRFPPELPFFLGTRMDYHWFVHAQISATTNLTGIDPLAMLRFLIPTLTLALGLLGLGAVALRLTRRPVAAVIAPALLVAGGYHLMGPDYSVRLFWEPYLTPRFLSSPSQAYGVMVSMPAVMLVLEVLRPKVKAHVLVWVAMTLALLALTGAKATFAPIFVCGALGVWGIELLRTRRVPRQASALVVIMIGVFLFAQLILLGGNSGGMELAPFKTVMRSLGEYGIPQTPRNIALMSAATLTGWLLYGIGVIGLGRKVLDPRAVWILVCIPAGIAIPFLLFRSGLSQLWFSRAVAELVVLLSAWGMARVLPRPLTNRQGALYGGLAVAAGAAAYFAGSKMQEAQGTADATVESLTLTVAVPVAIMTAFAVLRLAGRRTARFPTVPLAGLLSLLLGLGFSNVIARMSDPVMPGFDTVRLNPNRVLFAPGGVEAGRYIAENSEEDAIVATNVHCLAPAGRPVQEPPKCDGRSFWVAASTERRVVLEGWGYTAAARKARNEARAAGLDPDAAMPDLQRLEVNDRVFTDPSADALDTLVDRYGADWLLVSEVYEVDLEGLARLERQGLLRKEYEKDPYVVYRVLD